MTARPHSIVAVDVDGVVNALPRAEDDLDHFSRWQRKVVNGFVLTVAGEVLDWLDSLPEHGGRFHWATTWTPHRHLLEEAFGMPADAPIAADPDRRDGRGHPTVSWKGTQVIDLVERTERPLVWMDDDAITAGTVVALDTLAKQRSLPVLAVVPWPPTGLQPADLAAVDHFLDEVAAGTASPGLVVHRGHRKGA